jgi:hypothetical protein
LTTFPCALPLLREGRSSSVQFNNLLNPPAFKDHATFQSEYLHMYDDAQIVRHFSLRRLKSEANKGNDPRLAELSAMMGMELTPFMAEGYMVWERCSGKTAGKLLAKSALEKWLHALVLKICLPFPRPYMSNRPVHAPLNMTQFFRLLVHISKLGYPTHWLSDVVASVCSGTIVTTARPPSELVTTPESVDRMHPREKVSIQPWWAELTTLLSIWHQMLPFRLVIKPKTLVATLAISEYSVTFPSFETPNNNVPHFVLLFWNAKTQKRDSPPGDMRKFFIETCVAPGSETRAQEGVHCVTTFKYDAPTRSATFWMRDDVVEEMKKGSWKAYIARTDSWVTASKAVDVVAGVEKLRSWVDA